MRTPIALLAAVLCTSTLAFSQSSPSVEDRLRSLEQKLDSLSKENADLRRQLGVVEKPKTAQALLAPVGKETKLSIGGLVHAQGEFGGADDPRFSGVNDRLYLRRARIYTIGSFAEHFEFKVEGDFTANSLTPGSSLRAQAEEIYIGWNRFPEASVRFGNLKPGFGWERLQSDTVIPTIERSLSTDRITDSRQVSLSLAGVLFDKRVGYLLAVGNGTGIASSTNDNNKFLQSLRLYGVPFQGKFAGEPAKVLLGVSSMRSEDVGLSKTGFGLDSTPGGSVDNVFTGKRHGLGADATLILGPASLEAEYLTMHFAPTNRFPKDCFNAEGWHLNLCYSLLDDQLQFVAQRSSLNPNTSVSLGNHKVETWVIGANWLIKGNDLKLMLDYLFRDANSTVTDDGRLIVRMQVLY